MCNVVIASTSRTSMLLALPLPLAVPLAAPLAVPLAVLLGCMRDWDTRSHVTRERVDSSSSSSREELHSPPHMSVDTWQAEN